MFSRFKTYQRFSTKLKLLGALLIFALSMLSCNAATQTITPQPPTPTQPVEFYKNFGDPQQDYLRVPLIKPYYVTGSSYPGGLGITLYYRETKPYSDVMSNFFGINGVAKFAVENGVIVVMTEKKRAGGLQWFVIVPDKQIETGFANESEFKKYILAYNLTEPLWFEPRPAWKQLRATGCLPWIPGC